MPRPTTKIYQGWRWCTVCTVAGAFGFTCLEFSFNIALSGQMLSNGFDLRAGLTDGTILDTTILSVTPSGAGAVVRCLVVFPVAPVDGSLVFFYYKTLNTADYSNFSFINRMRYAPLTDLSFSYPLGLRQFCLVYAQGNYNLFYMYQSTPVIAVKISPTLAGLSAATENVLTVESDIYDPAAYFDGSNWHLWCYRSPDHDIRHYISATSDPTSLYTYNDSLGKNVIEISMLRATNGKFYMAAVDNSGGPNTNKLWLFVSNSINGPWTDKGDVFSAIGRSGWHYYSMGSPGDPYGGVENNTGIVEYGGKLFVCFDGRDMAAVWRVGIVEVDFTTGKAVNNAVVLIDDHAASTDYLGGKYLYDGINPPRIYYGKTGGTELGYLQLSSPAPDRHPNAGGRVIFGGTPYLPFNVAAGIKPEVWGTGAITDKLTVSTGAGGLYCSFDGNEMGNFTARIDFIPYDTAPASKQLIFSLDGWEDPIWGFARIRVYVDTSGKLLYVFYVGHDSGVPGNLLWLNGSAVLSNGTPYTLRIGKASPLTTAILNGAVDMSSNDFANSITGAWALRNFSLANAKNYIRVAGEQFYGEISRFEFHGNLVIPGSTGAQQNTFLTFRPHLSGVKGVLTN